MSMTTSVRIGPVRSQGYSGQRSHDLRHGKALDYVDATRSHLNTGDQVPTLDELHQLNEDAKYAAQEAAQALWDAAQASGDPEAIKAAKVARNACRQRYDRQGVVAYRAILTYGREAGHVVEALDPAEQDRLARAALQQVADTLGTRVLGISAHRDESKLHYHAYFAGVTLAGKKLNPGKGQCRQVQTVAAEPYKHLGIKRGKSKDMWIEEGADPAVYTHASVAELHARLPLELAAARQAVAEAKVELDRIRAEAAVADFGKMLVADEAEKLQETVSALRTRVDELETLGGQWDAYIDSQEAYSRKLAEDIKAKEAEFGRLTGLVDETREANELENQMEKGMISVENDRTKKMGMA